MLTCEVIQAIVGNTLLTIIRGFVLPVKRPMRFLSHSMELIVCSDESDRDAPRWYFAYRVFNPTSTAQLSIPSWPNTLLGRPSSACRAFLHCTPVAPPPLPLETKLSKRDKHCTIFSTYPCQTETR